MSISIRSNGVDLTESFRTWITDRISMAVERLGRSTQRVQVFLADENGPSRGGNDKSCRVVVQVAHQSSLVIVDRDSNVGALVERVADRIASVVDRRVERRHNHRG